MDIITELEKCLSYPEPTILDSETDKNIRQAIIEIKRLRDAITNWSGYGWKNSEYIDNLEEYFTKINEENNS